jgi:hypothetical protein
LWLKSKKLDIYLRVDWATDSGLKQQRLIKAIGFSFLDVLVLNLVLVAISLINFWEKSLLKNLFNFLLFMRKTSFKYT